jgi:ATP-dependent phosphofructokinase / diphosphate-dependent phosphofructokinase
MMKKKIRLGILTGGGDCPGLNPAIKWIVNSALSRRDVDFTCIGIRDGWRGLLQDEYPGVESLKPNENFGEHYLRGLDKTTVRAWDRIGGTSLGSSRTNPFKELEGGGDRSDKLLDNIRSLGLDALIAIGGEDTLGVLWKIHRKVSILEPEKNKDLAGLKLVGVPKTIDLDLPGTEYSLGFETAVSVITEEVDRIRTTAGSHRRVFVVETMGRYAGHLALQGGVSAGAFIVLIPELKFNLARVVRMLVERQARGERYSIVIVAEGAQPDHLEKPITKGKRSAGDEFRGEVLGGVGEYLAGEIQKATDWEVRHVVLSHLQRGGTPVAYDRRMGRLFGVAAVDLVLGDETGRMVCLQNGAISHVSLEELDGARLHLVKWQRDPEDCERPEQIEYDVERYNAYRAFDVLPDFEVDDDSLREEVRS